MKYYMLGFYNSLHIFIFAKQTGICCILLYLPTEIIHFQGLTENLL